MRPRIARAPIAPPPRPAAPRDRGTKRERGHSSEPSQPSRSFRPGKKGKGKSKGAQRASKTPKPKADWCTSFKGCEICKRYQCTSDSCRFVHVCAINSSIRLWITASSRDAGRILGRRRVGRSCLRRRSLALRALRCQNRLGLDGFEPFDLDHNQAHDILNNTVLEALLKLCWSGLIALIMLAPPCKKYSGLKLRPGGPNMNGVPGLSPSQLKRLQDSQATHERGRALFIAVVSKGGIGIWEQPPSAMSWLEEANFHTLRKHQCSLV